MSTLTDLLKAPDVAAADQLYIVDTSDTTDNPAGSSRRVPLSDITTTVLAKTKIQSVTDPGVAGFVFTIPSGTSRVWIDGAASSARANNVDSLLIYLNGGSSATGYYRQQNTAADGINVASETPDDATIGVVSAATSSDTSARYVSIMVDNLSSGLPAYAIGHTVIRRASTNMQGQISYTDTPLTDEVTSITITSGTGEALNGTLTCYAERELTVLNLT